MARYRCNAQTKPLVVAVDDAREIGLVDRNLEIGALTLKLFEIRFCFAYVITAEFVFVLVGAVEVLRQAIVILGSLDEIHLVLKADLPNLRFDEFELLHELAGSFCILAFAYES